MTTAYSRIDRFLRENLNDDNYSSYKDELDAICQAKLQRTWVGLTGEDCKNMSEGDRVFVMWAEAKLKEKNT